MSIDSVVCAVGRNSEPEDLLAKPREVSNIAWAFATARAFATAKITFPGLFDRLSSAVIERKQEFSPQDIANTLWAYATLGLVKSPLFEGMAPRVKDCSANTTAKILPAWLGRMLWQM